MGWKNSPSVLCTTTETATVLANQKLCDPCYQPDNHKLAIEAAQGRMKVETTPTLLWKVQKLLKLWDELLRVTDRALDVKGKSDWTLISFIWKNGIAELQKMDYKNKLQLRDH